MHVSIWSQFIVFVASQIQRPIQCPRKTNAKAMHSAPINRWPVVMQLWSCLYLHRALRSQLKMAPNYCSNMLKTASVPAKHQKWQLRRKLLTSHDDMTRFSRVLGHGFRPPLNPTVENTRCTLRTDTEINESWDLAHKTTEVISAIKPIHTYKLMNCNAETQLVEGPVNASMIMMIGFRVLLSTI